MRHLHLISLIALSLVSSSLLLACGDDDGGGDAATDAATDTAADAATDTAADTATDTALDVAEDTSTGPMFPEGCIGMADATLEQPWAIPDVLTNAEVWSRPDDDAEDTCPAARTVDDVPFKVFQFCNDSDAVYRAQFELTAVEGDDADPAGDLMMFFYDGAQIPSDTQMCFAWNDDRDLLTTDAEYIVEMPVGTVVTLVATAKTTTDGGSFLLVAGPEFVEEEEE